MSGPQSLSGKSAKLPTFFVGKNRRRRWVVQDQRGLCRALFVKRAEAMRFAIYVRKGEETYDRVGEVPEQLRIRTLAVRAFDSDAMMVGWELVDGCELEAAIERLFLKPRANYLHVHFAAPGCYAARVDRA